MCNLDNGYNISAAGAEEREFRNKTTRTGTMETKLR